MNVKLLFPLLLLFAFHASAQPTRSPLGTPGPGYWQNRADYDIRATLDTSLHKIIGKVSITYTNNSPYPLDYLWLQLDQNKFRADSRGALANPSGSRHEGSITNGFEIGGVFYNGLPMPYTVTDTRLQARLKAPLASGAKASITIDYSFAIPEAGADRMGRIRLEDGWVYEIAQWYPRLAVLDDVAGWNNLPYLGPGEFYCEYGDFEYTIDVPNGFVVAGSGELLNPGEVLPRSYAKKLEAARQSDSTLFIISPDEAGNAPVGSGKRGIWKFRLENARDVAWACGKGLIWDAGSAKLPGGERVLIQSFYPRESLSGWGRATEYARASVEHYAEKWFEYPYPTLCNVAGTVGGMEYPALHFTEYDRSGNRLWVTLDHEVAHNWFPMIVGSNERQHAWMDEGFVTFMGYYAARAFEGADYSSYISDYPAMRQRFMEADLGPVARPPREISKGFSDVVYFKPAIALLTLREYVLGPERFDYAFRQYIRSWAYKHPRPEDFFNCMENASGEELDWFWQSWFYQEEKLDQEISNARRRDDGSVFLTLANNLGMPMPVVVEFTLADGSKERRELPVDIWNQGNAYTFTYRAGQPVQSILLDPDEWLPDVERRNNGWAF
ncbi:MAG: M1 family metallopeptidase [Lewinellaceae bacterium]|nr:M1 family metallopeptidase [Lewinellaceae bacterium]